MLDDVHILLIEDGLVDAAVFRAHVAKIPGWRVTHVSRLEEAEELVEEVGAHQFHLVAVDLGLPDAVELEAIEFALRTFPHAPCVAVTARDPGEIETKAIQTGAMDVLEKGKFNERGTQRSLTHALQIFRYTERMRRSEANFRSLLRSSPGALFVVQHGKIVFTNDAGSVWEAALTDEDAKFAIQISPGESLRTDVSRGPDGVATVALTCARVNWEHQPADVVHLVEIAPEMQAPEADAPIVDDPAKRRAVQAIHDIRARVMLIEDLVGQLPEDAEIQAELAEHMRIVAGTVSDVLTHARPSTEAACFDLGVVAESTCQNLHRLISPTASLRTEFESATEIVANRTTIERAITNLITNAVDAMRDHPRDQHELLIRVKHTGHWVELVVADTGPGIPPAQCATLFTKPQTTKPDGHGFGLQQVKGAVDDLEGEVEVGPERAGRRPVHPPIPRPLRSGIQPQRARRRRRPPPWDA